MILIIALTLLTGAAVNGQGFGHSKCALKLKNDLYSPFFYGGYDNVCYKTMCDQYPWLPCNVPEYYIMEQALGHREDDIYAEIEYLEQYIKTRVPMPDNRLPYHCQGLCQDPAKQLKLERIFQDLTLKDNITGKVRHERHMCIVLGPNMNYQRCGGKCKIPYGGGSSNSYCVSDVVLTTDVWLYCPRAKPSCHKVRYDIPLSCTCKRFRCKKNHPSSQARQPIIPAKPPNWKPNSDPWFLETKADDLGMIPQFVDVSGTSPNPMMIDPSMMFDPLFDPTNPGQQGGGQQSGW